MDYNLKLRGDRYRQSTSPKSRFDEEMESDRGRAINSAALRRLQQKTQVFPLELNAAVRSRLTHSLEVQQVGRYIAKKILTKLDKEVPDLGLDQKQGGFISAVEMACLLHDVGNPPFGHFGESAINDWSRSTLRPLFIESFKGLNEEDERLKDLMTFEGNAQAIRILHSLQTMNLTFTQLACLIKYTRAAYEPRPNDKDTFAYRKKKPGYYWSEKALIKKLSETLQIKPGCRFPLTYIMEAADDISYCIADLDDALDKGILSITQLHEAIVNTWNGFKGRKDIDNSTIEKVYLPNLCRMAKDRADVEAHNQNHAYIVTLRTGLVNDLANYAAEQFIANHQAMFDGTWDSSLLHGNDEYHLATEALKEVAITHVFSHREVERLELKGHAIITGLLNIFTPLLKLSFEDAKALAQSNFLKSAPIETRLYHALPNKLKTSYRESVKDIFSLSEPTPDNQLTEKYFRARLIIDHISGMTDGFALEEYRALSAAI